MKNLKKILIQVLCCIFLILSVILCGFNAVAGDDCTSTSDWSDEYPYGQPEENIEEIELYSYYDTEIKTEVSSNANLTLDGWTLVSRDDGVWGEYGPESGWTKTKPVENDYRRITDTQTVTDKAAYIQYEIFFYKYVNKYKNNQVYLTHSKTDAENNKASGTKVVEYKRTVKSTDIKKSKVRSGKQSYVKASGYYAFKGEFWFIRDSKTKKIPAVTHKEYKYQERVKNYTYVFSKEGEPSEYSVIRPDNIPGRTIETKKMYRYSYASHTYNDYYTVDKEASCIEAGIKSIHCAKCGATKNITAIPATGHTLLDEYLIDKLATCTEDGSESLHCIKCGASTNAKVIPATGHTLTEEYVIDKVATCTENGEKSRYCTVCSERDDIVTLEKTGHVWKTKVTKATTKKNGKKVYTCEFCSKEVTKSIAKIASVELSSTSYTYNNKAKTPSVVVTDSGGKKLKKNVDYTVKYSSGRKNIGTYSVKVTFKGNYSGSKTVKFTIKLGKVKNVTQDTKKKGIAFRWDKVIGASGYEVYYYDTNKGQYKKLMQTKETGIYNKSAKGKLKVKIRAYRNGNDGKKIYGAFSSAKTFRSI